MKLTVIVLPWLLISSPPARGRGLKLAELAFISNPAESPPARGRGLKLAMAIDLHGLARRPPRGGVD